MNNESDMKFRNYVYDVGVLFKKMAREAKCDKDNFSGVEDNTYKMGYLMAFHEIIDVMKQQAKAFNIEQRDIGLEDIDAESDLL